MNSSLKYAIPLGLIVIVVFGVTVINLNVVTPVNPVPVPGEDGEVVGDLLSFPLQKMGFDPAPQTDDLWPQKYFQGFYEVKDEQIPIPFWFRNKNKVPVSLTVTGRSCTSCTRARVAIVPAAVFKSFANYAAAGALVQSPLGIPDLMTALPAVMLLQSLSWQELEFDHPEKAVEIPAAADDGTPTWGVFQMMVRVSGVGVKPLHAFVGMRAGGGPPTTLRFDTAVIGVAPFTVQPKAIPLGELPEGAGPKSGFVVCWSATRGFDDFPPPLAISGGKDPFLHVGTPVKMTDTDLTRFDAEMARDGQRVRATSGYIIPFTVLRRLPDSPPPPSGAPKEPDIGPFERFIDVSGVGGLSQRVSITATVTGLVNLTDGKMLEFEKSFLTSYGASLEKTWDPLESTCRHASLSIL